MGRPKSFDTLVSFTYKGKARLKADGGSGDWALNPENALKCKYLIITRNTNGAPPTKDRDRRLESEGNEPHRSAFLAGRIKGVRLANDQPTGPNQDPRYVVEVSSWADLPNIPDIWKKDRLPFRYAKLEELGVRLDHLVWEDADQARRESIANVNKLLESDGEASAQASHNPIAVQDTSERSVAELIVALKLAVVRERKLESAEVDVRITIRQTREYIIVY